MLQKCTFATLALNFDIGNEPSLLLELERGFAAALRAQIEPKEGRKEAKTVSFNPFLPP